MVVQYLGLSSVKVSMGDTTIAFAPISKESKSKIKPAIYGADIVFLPCDDPDYNGKDQVTYGNKNPFVISGPGEYEVGGVFARGVRAGVRPGKRPVPVTAFYVTFDEINILYVGALSSAKDLGREAQEDFGDIDIMLVPIYDGEVMNAVEAYKLVGQLSPKMVVPLGMGPDSKDSTNLFLKEAGETGEKLQDKLTLRRRDFEGKSGEVVPLRAT